jgi:hypothetical protein
MTTRKELEAKCEELAENYADKKYPGEAIDAEDWIPYNLAETDFQQGFHAALDLTWPMIEGIRAEVDRLQNHLGIEKYNGADIRDGKIKPEKQTILATEKIRTKPYAPPKIWDFDRVDCENRQYWYLAEDFYSMKQQRDQLKAEVEELKTKLERTSSCEKCGYSTMTHEPISKIDQLLAKLKVYEEALDRTEKKNQRLRKMAELEEVKLLRAKNWHLIDHIKESCCCSKNSTITCVHCDALEQAKGMK